MGDPGNSLIGGTLDGGFYGGPSIGASMGVPGNSLIGGTLDGGFYGGPW